MNPRPSIQLTLLAAALLTLTGCQTPGSSKGRPNEATAWTEPASPPIHLPPLRRLVITSAFEPAPLRLYLPPPRGKAMQVTLRRYKTGGQLYSQAPEAVPHVPDPVAAGAAMALFGGLQGVATGVGILKGSCHALITGARGIPASEHAPALQAITRVQSRHLVTSEVIDRLRNYSLARADGGSLFRVNNANERADTLLELYDGKQQLSGDGAPDPLLRLELGYRCTLIRASDHQKLHVFRVGYASQGRRLREWAANDAAPLAAELERALASLTDQIVSQLTAINARHESSPNRPELVQTDAAASASIEH